MVSMLTSSVLDHGFKPKTIKIDICCFSAKHAALRCKNNDWLALIQDNVYEKIYISSINGRFQGEMTRWKSVHVISSPTPRDLISHRLSANQITPLFLKTNHKK
jgi:hypothetical protein